MTSSLAFLDGIGGPELLLIFVLSLMLFGGKKMPELARGFGRSVREFKRAAAGVEQEIKRAMDETPPAPRPAPPPPALDQRGTPPAPPAPPAASSGASSPPAGSST